MTIEHILRDIEFELAQGTISRDELGESIQAVRQYQNKLRSEVFQTKNVDMQDLLSRQFQMNDMLITMLQETVAALHIVQLEAKQTANLTSQVAPLTPPPHPISTSSVARLSHTAVSLPAAANNLPPSPHMNEVEAKRNSQLQQEATIRPSHLPFIGAFISRVRGALHSLVLFYVNKLAHKQEAINNSYGDSLLQLHATQQLQQQYIAHLQAQLAIRQEQSE